MACTASHPTTELAPGGSDGGSAVRIQRIEADEIDESSGLARSRQYPGVFWTHNDSGGGARLFAIRSNGVLIAEFPLEGVKNRDWEDITIDDAGRLYVGDIGNNLNARRDLAIHVVVEPDPFAGGRPLEVERTIRFRYSDQKHHPGFRNWNFDAEALFLMNGTPHVLTKHRSDRRTTLYRIPVPEDEAGEALAIPLARFDLRRSANGRVEIFDGHAFERSWGGLFDFVGNVTGADLHASQRWLAILSYHALHVYEVQTSQEGFSASLRRRIPLRFRHTRMVESVTWDGDSLVIGNEQGRLFFIHDPFDPALREIPP